MFTIKMKFGNAQLEFADNDIKQIHKFMSVWGQLPQVCDCCKSPNVILNHKSPSGNDYYGVKCKDCGAELNLHQRKEGGFYFKNGDKMAVWSGGEQDTGQPVKTPKNDKIPF